MSHTYVQNVVHVVFSTRERQRMIPKEFQPRMWSYIAGICKHQKFFVHAIGGMEDHVHGLIQVPAALSLADVVLAIKSNFPPDGIHRCRDERLPKGPRFASESLDADTR